MIQVALADDHLLFRKSMKMLIDSFEGMSLVLEASNGRELLMNLSQYEVDVVLLDVQMPEMDGKTTCQILRQNHPDIKVLILSQLESRELIIQMMELGAHGFFTKNSEPHLIQHAIKSLDDNGFYFDQQLTNVLKGAVEWEKKYRSSISDPEKVEFSDREQEIMLGVCREKSMLELSEEFEVSPRTIESHKQRMMNKVGARNFIGVIVYAVKNDLIDLNEV